MQMTPIAVEQASADCGLAVVAEHDKMHDRTTNIRYGTCYLSQLLEEMEGNWTETLIVYNGGYLQLQKYRSGGNMVQETSNYVLQVERALTNNKECK